MSGERRTAGAQRLRHGGWTFERIYSWVFVSALAAVTVGLVVAAATSSADDRGGFIGLAIMVGSFDAMLLMLLVAVERRLRAGRSTSAAADDPS